MTETDDLAESSPIEQHFEDSLCSVREILKGLKYGSVLLTVHEGRVVQLDVTEKKRLE